MKLRLKHIFFFSFGIIVLSSCFQKEDPIEPFPRGDVSNSSISMGASYTDQFYFSLEENRVVKQIPKTLWDIAFSCDPGSQTVRLNSGRFMFAAGTGKSNFEEVKDTAGLEFIWDWSNGKSDSTALSEWSEGEQIYVINLGQDASANQLGFIKAKITKSGDNWELEYAPIESNILLKATLKTNTDYNHVYFSFLTNEVVEAEPMKENYDLVFRQYTYYFAPEDLPYQVVGCLTNPHSTRVAEIFNIPFSELTLSDTAENMFSHNLDVVGYDWKEFKLSSGVYVVYANQNYILQNSKGFFYKFHFTDYYSQSGERGYPLIEFKQL